MIETLLGSNTAGKVLMYLHNYDEGYALGISRTFDIPLNAVQRQLRKYESIGLLVSRLVGRTRVFSWNPRAMLAKSVRALLADAMAHLPDDEVRAYYRERRRPRRTGKPL